MNAISFNDPILLANPPYSHLAVSVQGVLYTSLLPDQAIVG